jgi:hypothetical protein
VAKFGYKLDMIFFFKIKHPSVIWLPAGTYCQNLAKCFLTKSSNESQIIFFQVRKIIRIWHQKEPWFQEIALTPGFSFSFFSY